MEVALRPWGDYTPSLSKEPPWQWCDEHLKLKDSPLGRNFKSWLTPWLKLPMEAYASNDTEELTAMCCVQGCKTTFILGCMMWACSVQPGPMLYTAQTDPDAQKFAKERAWPALLALGIGGQLDIPDERTKRSTCYLSLPVGWIELQGANLNNLSSKTVRWVNNDELHLWKKGLLSESRKRATKYWNKRICNASTGAEVGSDLDESFEAGTKEEWHLACPSCGELNLPKFERLKWSKDCKLAAGGYDFQKVMDTTRFECVHCKELFEHTATFSKIANDGGQYIQTNPNPRPKHRSFRWNALCLPPTEVSWGQLAVEFLVAMIASAQGNDVPLRKFLTMRMAESWDPNRFAETKALPVSTAGPWAPEAYRFLTVDVQQDHFWGVVRAWAKDGRSRGFWAGKMLTWQEVEDKAAELNVSPVCVFVDSSFNTQEVYSECALRNKSGLGSNGKPDWFGWKALNGEAEARKNFIYRPAKGKPRVLAYSWPPTYIQAGIGRAMEERKYCKLHLWSNAAVKDVTIKLRDGRGAEWLGPPDCPAWQKQMFSERKVRRYDAKGQPKDEWQVIGRAENHLWDCENMQTVAAMQAECIGSGIQTLEDLRETLEGSEAA